MKYSKRTYPYSYFTDKSIYPSGNIYYPNPMYRCPYCPTAPERTYSIKPPYPHTNKGNLNKPVTNYQYSSNSRPAHLQDYGNEPFVINIDEAAELNQNFRLALWTGNHLQLTLMNIEAGEDIGLEVHPDNDQLFHIEEGRGLVMMGDRSDLMDFQSNVAEDDVFIVPAGKWHNIINVGNSPLKLFSVYAPPIHPFGTVHPTKADAEH